MADPRMYDWREILDRLDSYLHVSGAFADDAVFAARRDLGRAIGCLVVSAEQGRRVGKCVLGARSFRRADARHE